MIILVGRGCFWRRWSTLYGLVDGNFRRESPRMVAGLGGKG